MVNWDLAVNVTVTGILLVFIMLLLLVFILYVFGFVSVTISKSKDKKAQKSRAAAFAEMTANSVVNENTEIVPQQDDSEDEIVAVISAAIASLYQNSNVKPVIKSIKKSSSRRSSWAKAGISENTRAF